MAPSRCTPIYLGRYTHRVGLSNHRIRDVSEQGVRFTSKHGKDCTLTPVEFIRRFLLHVLPTGFVKIRHYGLLAGSNIKTKLVRARSLLTASAPAGTPGPVSIPLAQPSSPPAQAEARPKSLVAQLGALLGRELMRCPQCRRGTLRYVPVGSFAQWRPARARVTCSLAMGIPLDSS